MGSRDLGKTCSVHVDRAVVFWGWYIADGSSPKLWRFKSQTERNILEVVAETCNVALLLGLEQGVCFLSRF